MPHSGVEFTTIQPRGGGGIRDNYGWLRDMINKFGERGGFDLLASRAGAEEATVRDLAALIAPLANCCELLDHDVLEQPLSKLVNTPISSELPYFIQLLLNGTPEMKHFLLQLHEHGLQGGGDPGREGPEE